MSDQDNILGTSADISVDRAALDILAARQAENRSQVESADDIAANPHPSENGKVSWSTPGTPYVSDRYLGQPMIPSPPPPPPPPIADPLPSVSYASRETPWGVIDPVNAGYASRVPEILASWRLSPEAVSPAPSALHSMPGEESASPRYSSYDAASQMRSDIQSDARNLYTARGDFDKIGSHGFNQEIADAEISAGLRESKPRGIGSALANMREDFADPTGYGKLNYGYAIQQLGQEGSQYYQKTNSGDYLTPEQQGSAAAGFLPGAGAVLGTAIGSAVAPGVGSWVGGMVGGGVGSAAQGVIGSYEDRNQASRQIGDEFTAALGEATSNLREFSSQAQATGAPLKELQQVIGIVGSVSPLGANAIPGAGAMTNALGEYAPSNYASVSQQLRDPSLFGTALNFGQNGRLSAEEYGALGTRAAITGDAQALYQDNLGAQRSQLADNAQYQAARRDLTEAENPFSSPSNLLGALAQGFNGIPARIGRITADYAQLQTIENNQTGDPGAKARNDLFKQFGEIREDEDFYGSLTGVATGAREGIARRGGSAASIRRATGFADEAFSAQENDLDVSMRSLRGQLASNTNPSLAPFLRREIETEKQQRIGIENQSAGLDQQDFANIFDESQSGQQLGIARGQFGLTSALISGGSYQSQRDAESASEGSGTAYAGFLDATSRAVNPLNPTQRAQMESEAISEQQRVMQQRYSFAQNLYGEENASLGISRAGREADVSRADVLGTPQDQYAASLNSLTSDRQQIAQNNSELSRGNLTFAQRQDLQRQNVGLQSDLDTGPERARISAYDAEGGILGNTQSADRALLSRDVAINGSSAYRSAFADDQSRINLFQGAEAGSPVGSAQRARYGAEAAQARAGLLDDTEQSQVYRETSQQRIQDTTTEGAFRRSLEAPYMDGSAESSPFTRGNAELSLLRNRLGQAQKTLASATDPLAREEDTGIVERYKDQIADISQEQRTGFLRALPEFIGGSPGQGNLSGVLPTPGQSAFYSGNPFISGTFGQPSRSLITDGDSGHTPQAGGAAGAFMAGSGVDKGIGALTAAIDRLHSDLTRGGVGGRSAAVAGQPSGYSQNVNLQTNAYRPGQ